MELEGKEKLGWILKTGWLGRCPHCGKGRMFASWLKLAKRCDACGLDYSFASPDDGPAFFAMTIISFPLVGFAIWLELAYSPGWWVHLLTSGPLILGSCIASLRPLKGWIVASQYVNKAEEAGSEELARRLRARDAGL
ncbi:DUF983 domain-containing protein [Pedomonas mirosovicensis]|uniref:DUF983 domain-containing protein n=1 Tax=Pedomonas mirosovicensis TaxID=2908641 RepID=UPI002167FCF5|nr:DUF983 domain-containing protein [Pedomonas mirosovicensis]MCH8686284.1 DUF983 domain-containing protein [Pedomonas mirosovicensis]